MYDLMLDEEEIIFFISLNSSLLYWDWVLQIVICQKENDHVHNYVMSGVWKAIDYVPKKILIFREKWLAYIENFGLN